jgi:outer membrane protein TolC
MRWLFGVALIATTGCVSSQATRSRTDVEKLLARPSAGAPSAPVQARAGAPSPPTGADPKRGAAGGTDCASLAQRVALAHPRVRAAEERARAALSRSRASGSLPPPKASLEVWDFPFTEPGRADSEGMYMLGLEQEFPPAGARDARTRAEAEEGRMAVADAAAFARELWSEAAHECVTWSVAEALRLRLSEHRALLAEMRETVLTRYRAGGDVLGGLVQLEAEIATADRHVIEAEAEARAARETLMALGDGDVPASAPPLQRPRELEATEALAARAARARAENAVASARTEAARARLDAAASEASSPAFGAKAAYMQAPGARPGLQAMVSMTLPWLWGGSDAERASAEHELNAAEALRADVSRSIRVDVARASGRVLVLSRARQALVERELPAVERALAVERAALAAGSADLVSFVARTHALSELHVEETRISGELAHAWVDLEAAVGDARATEAP